MHLIELTLILYSVFCTLILFNIYIHNKALIDTDNKRTVSLAKHQDKITALNNDLSLIYVANSEAIASLNNEVTTQKAKEHSLKLELTEAIATISSIKKSHAQELTVVAKESRKDAIKRSRSVIRGQASEHLAPYVLKDTNPKDYRFMGNPIDFICFEGLSDLLDGVSNEITSVHFIDIKTGKASLSKSQRRIRDAIKESRVKFSVINLDKELEENNKLKEHES